MAGFFDLYPDYEYPLAQLQLVLFMVGMGATLSLADFAPVFAQPRALLYGLTFELILTPLIALLVARVAGLEPGLAVGLLLIGALPGGTLSNAFTFLARGNVPLSIALSATATLLAILTIPLVLQLLGDFALAGRGEGLAHFEMPVRSIVQEILLCMLLPLAAGMAVARYAPAHARWVSRVCVLLGFLLVVVMVVGAVGAGRIEVGEHGWKAPLAIIAFCVLTQQAAMIAIRFSGWPTGDWVAVGIEATVRNIYLGILLAALLFPATAPDGGALGKQVLFVVLFYGPASMGAALPLALRIRRVQRKEEQAA